MSFSFNKPTANLSLEIFNRKRKLKSELFYISFKRPRLSSIESPATDNDSNIHPLPSPDTVLFPSQQVVTGWKASAPVGAGFINMGNTCYLNSALQALFHVTPFVNWLLNRKPCDQCEGKDLCIICRVSKTLEKSQAPSGNAIRPSLVYDDLASISKNLVPGSQEDAHEFLRCLIESMERSYLQSVNAAELDPRSKETNPLSQIFGGYVRTQITCLQCRHKSTTFQHFQDISLNIQKCSTLKTALAQYFRSEKIEDYKCSSCEKNVSVTKTMSMEQSPNVLCIQLQRFDFKGRKTNESLNCPRQLNLNKYLSRPTVNGCVSYRFVSLINHIGRTQHFGHYNAMAQASNERLYLFDDCSVEDVPVTQNMDSALTASAYVLMYEKVQESSIKPKVVFRSPKNLPITFKCATKIRRSTPMKWIQSKTQKVLPACV